MTTRPSPSLPFPQNQTLLSAPTLIGSWRFTKYQYQGQTRPAPNPDLLLIFTFNTDQTSRLYWKRTDENGFCERLARYQIEGSLLRQKIFWTNPKNSLSCGQDPDMQMNRESTTPFLLRENELVLVLELNGDPFYYILEPSSPPPPDEAKF